MRRHPKRSRPRQGEFCPYDVARGGLLRIAGTDHEKALLCRSGCEDPERCKRADELGLSPYGSESRRATETTSHSDPGVKIPTGDFGSDEAGEGLPTPRYFVGPGEGRE